MTKYTSRVIGSTDVYSRKHIDKQFDRLERLRGYDKESIRDLRKRVQELESLIGLHLKHIMEGRHK